MYCVECGDEILESAKFCGGCGVPQQNGEIPVAQEIKVNPVIPEYPAASLELTDKYEELSTDELIKVAEQDEPIAWVVLAKRYYEGNGIEQSYSKVYSWSQKAAESGEPRGIHNLGVLYEYGDGVEKDGESAANQYYKAAKLGYKPAIRKYASCLKWGVGVEKDQEKAHEWFRLGAERGDENCQDIVGDNFLYGQGVGQDDDKAIYWYQKSAKQNNCDALCSLGWMHERGRGVEKDPAKGCELYLQAAGLGSLAAMSNLGASYKRGDGVEKSLPVANEWYLKAAEGGHGRAMYNLGRSYEYGEGCSESWESAEMWYQKAAEKGDKEADFRAQFRLLSISEFGEYKKKVEQIRFFRTSGTVLEHKRSSETHVSSSGGGGYVSQYGGHIEQAKVHSTVVTTDDFWIETEGGGEEKISLTNKGIALRSGQKISIFYAILDTEESGPYFLLVNHSDGKSYWIKSAEEFMNKCQSKGQIYKKSVVAPLCTISIIGMLFAQPPVALYLIPLGVLSTILFNRFSDFKKIKVRLGSHFQKIEAWARKNG